MCRHNYKIFVFSSCFIHFIHLCVSPFNIVFIISFQCTVTTFVISAIVSHQHKLDMVHIQNSTLAGGVAIGSVCNLLVGPHLAILIGIISAIISVLGYQYLSVGFHFKRYNTVLHTHRPHNRILSFHSCRMHSGCEIVSTYHTNIYYFSMSLHLFRISLMLYSVLFVISSKKNNLILRRITFNICVSCSQGIWGM